jgi:glycosyltransferase involved in cell wall biosynthesis
VKEKSFKTLYLCYFGLREPLVQTQVLPYLREIKKGGTEASILTFEPNPDENWTTEQIAAEKQKLAAEGIEWNFLTYHKRPSVPATIYDIFCGSWFVWKKIRREKLNVLHARVHVPMIMGALAKMLTFGATPKLLFDIRGFVPEEYTDAGVWKENGLIYKVFKRIEKWLFKKADGFIVLTEKARDILFPESRETGFDRFGRPVEVIPCCINLKRFQSVFDERSRANLRRKFNLDNRFVIVHLGSLGGLYLTKEIADFYRAARELYPQAFALILTQSSPELIVPLLREHGFADEDILVKKVSPAEVPEYLTASDLALSFVKASYSTLSRSPTKIPEYLICGVPIVANGGVGDVDEQVTENRVGVLVDDFSRESFLEALRKIEDLRKQGGLVERCRQCAEDLFDLEKVGGAKYRRIYREITQKLVK